MKNITILTQRRDRERIERLNYKSISLLEILRAGIKTWEDRKNLDILR